MSLIRRVLLFLSVSSAIVVAATESDLPARVVILANADDRESIGLARAYAQARSIPVENVIALPLPLVETISWQDFLTKLWTPLQQKLAAGSWIDAIETTLTDSLGRRKWVVHGQRLSYLVICKGVPLRIEHDPALYSENLPVTKNPQFRHNTGAVDSELSLLAIPNYPINGFVLNPLFNLKTAPLLNTALIIKVSRLDGPSFDVARDLFISALKAEREGLIGRFSIDSGGPHPVGDRWLEESSKRLSALGYPGETDTSKDTLSSGSRVDELAWYFGWYTADIDGPFRLPGFRFAPGAIALHIHSFSATSLRSPSHGWSGPLITRGIAGTFGNVAEPFLEFSHQPQKIIEALSNGMTLGDAAYFAVTALSWQAIAIGDPLYRPFALSVEEQWAHKESLSSARVTYLALRRQNLAAQSASASPPIDLPAVLGSLSVSPASLLALSDSFELRGETPRARKTLERAAFLSPPSPAEWGLFAHIADRLSLHYESAESAVKVWKLLLDASQVPVATQITWLTKAVKAAKAADRLSLVESWERDLAVLKLAQGGTK